MILDIPPADLAAIRRGEKVCVRVRLPEQPPAHAREVHAFADGTIAYRPIYPGLYMKGAGGWQATLSNNPLGPVGTRHGVGEEWSPMEGRLGLPDVRYVYKADGPRHTPWFSAASIPERAVRTFVTTTALLPPERGEDGWYAVGEVVRC